jgi:hypothetical protein
MKRIGLLASMLVLGSAVAAQEPSPEASALYAPDDMTFQVPRQVGELSLAVEEMDAVFASGSVSIGTWQDLLIQMGKEPADASPPRGH